MNKVGKIATCSIGTALYVVLSMTIKIPIIGHASLDLGYIVLAVYCYYFGSIQGAIVGSIGCMFVSMLASGWFPPGWMVGNFLIGYILGAANKNSGAKRGHRVVIAVVSAFLGVFIMKTIIECCLYLIPLMVKIPKSFVVFCIDALVLSIGTCIAPKVPVERVVNNENY